MIETFCLARTSRHGRLLLAAIPFDRANAADLAQDQPVLLDHQGERVVGFVAVPSAQLRDVPGVPADATILAAGYGSSEVVAAISSDNAAALQVAQNLVGEQVNVRDAAWHWDRSRLSITLDAAPGDAREAIRERLASAFRAEIRFDWPGGGEVPDLGQIPEAGAGR